MGSVNFDISHCQRCQDFYGYRRRKKSLGYLDFCKTLRIIPFEPFEKYLDFEKTKGVQRVSNPQRIRGSSQRSPLRHQVVDFETIQLDYQILEHCQNRNLFDDLRQVDDIQKIDLPTFGCGQITQFCNRFCNRVLLLIASNNYFRNLQ